MFFFFNDTATTEIYTLSLHDALPISAQGAHRAHPQPHRRAAARLDPGGGHCARSEEHTSELQSHLNLVCRLLLEKKKSVYPRHQPNFRLPTNRSVYCGLLSSRCISSP